MKKRSAQAPPSPAAAIAQLDATILDLLNQRLDLARQAGAPAPVQVSTDREQEALARLEAANAGPLPREALRAIYREILSAEEALTRPRRVAYFGPAMTNTHLATLRKFGQSTQTVAKATIADVFDEVDKDRADFGVVPFENSTEGAVTSTFDLFGDFTDSDVGIVGEVYMRIHNHLMATGDMKDLRVLYSHPQVFGQCRRWLLQNLPQCSLVEVGTTVAGARRAAEEGPGSGALANELAAAHFGLRVLQHSVEDVSGNTTRFLVLGKTPPPPGRQDKTSILFDVKDRVGALYDALLPFKENEVNLTMIQSRPAKDRSWGYLFFVDFLGHADDPGIRRAIAGLSEHCEFVKRLGSYPHSPDSV